MPSFCLFFVDVECGLAHEKKMCNENIKEEGTEENIWASKREVT
jgi:hypothetical protein